MFSRRSAIFLGGQVLLLSGLGARMYYLQVIEADRYRTLADDNRISIRMLAILQGLLIVLAAVLCNLFGPRWIESLEGIDRRRARAASCRSNSQPRP